MAIAYLFPLISVRPWGRQQQIRPSITSGHPLLKPLVERECKYEGRIKRASSVAGWNCISNSSSTPSNSTSSKFGGIKLSNHTAPQIFAYEPRPGVFRNLNYPAFQSIKIEQVIDN